jgi:pseudaminic acid synthase
MKIGTYNITDTSPTFIVAELSANHNGKLKIAIETIKAAKRAGANAIKLQTYTADTLTINCKNDDFKIKQDTIWDEQFFYDLYKSAYTPWEWHKELFACANSEGLICFSSPFDKSAVDFLESLNCPAYKIASFEITDIPLIEYVASKNKPVIISTGIAGIEDITLAISACKQHNNEEIILLKCTSSYPSLAEDANLLMIPDFTDRFGVIAGLSDHTIGAIVPIVATTLGAKVIEKHFILDRSIGGPDSQFSMNEDEFKNMVNSIREAESAFGQINYTLTDKMLKSREFSRSLYVVENIKIGEIITEKNVRSIRPGFGLHPKYLNYVIGRKARINLHKGTRLSLKDLFIS